MIGKRYKIFHEILCGPRKVIFNQARGQASDFLVWSPIQFLKKDFTRFNSPEWTAWPVEDSYFLINKIAPSCSNISCPFSPISAQLKRKKGKATSKWCFRRVRGRSAMNRGQVRGTGTSLVSGYFSETRHHPPHPCSSAPFIQSLTQGLILCPLGNNNHI